MSAFPAYPVRLPGWRLAVQFGLSIRTEVLVVYDRDRRDFQALCPDFDHANPIRAVAQTVEELQEKLNEAFVEVLQKAFGKDPLMRPHLEVKLSLVPKFPEEIAEQETLAMLPRCCSARRFADDEKSGI